MHTNLDLIEKRAQIPLISLLLNLMQYPSRYKNFKKASQNSKSVKIGGFSGFTRPDSRITPRYGYRWKEEIEANPMIYGSSKTKSIFYGTRQRRK